MMQTPPAEQQRTLPLLAENIGVLSHLLIWQKCQKFPPGVHWESVFTKWTCQAAAIRTGSVLVCVLSEEKAPQVLGTCCY